LLRSKTQFAAIQMKAANERRKAKTSAARGHLLTHGKQPERSARRVTQVGAMLGAKINIIGTRQARSFVNVFDLSTQAMRLAFRGDGSPLAGTWSGVCCIPSAASSRRNEVPRKLLKNVKGVGRDLRAFGSPCCEICQVGHWRTCCTRKECQSTPGAGTSSSRGVAAHCGSDRYWRHRQRG
jgi:hypothetical protein